MEEAHVNRWEKGGLFPFSDYDIIVRSNEKTFARLRLHIISRRENYSVCLDIVEGCLLMVEKYGTRSNTSSFADVVAKAKEWLAGACTLHGFEDKTNRDMATAMWCILNEVTDLQAS